MKDVVIVSGLRSPFLKMGTEFKNIPAYTLGAYVAKELMRRLDLDKNVVDEVVVGNVAQPAEAANIARHVALLAEIPYHVPAVSVQRNCASGMEAIAYAYQKIQAGMGDVFLVGGTENMSQIPLMWNAEARNWLNRFTKCKTTWEKYRMFAQFKVKYLRPIVGLKLALSDRYCGLEMGHTAEILAKDFNISRKEQDEFSFLSHKKAFEAIESGKFNEEIMPIVVDDDGSCVDKDNGVRKMDSAEKLAKLATVFERNNGSVTAGNASQITDGAAFVIVMSAEKCKEMGYKPWAKIRSFAFAGLDPSYMGLGPAYATPLAFDKAGVTMKDMERVEINEAFAVQVLANLKIFSSEELSQKYLKRSALGEVNPDILNVNGGAIALGHPVGASAVRIVINLLQELQRENLSLGLATLCVGGGQGASFVFERL